MSNWRYANITPTSPWRSGMTLPRELRLVHTDAGIRLSQVPTSLSSLRLETLYTAYDHALDAPVELPI
jgi:fructan beta-fructosidase